MLEFVLAAFVSVVAAAQHAVVVQAEDSAPAAGSEPAGNEPADAARGAETEVARDAAAAPGSAVRQQPERCTYSTYNWSTEERRAVNRRTVDKAYADVTDDERSPEAPRCTVCSEDQWTIEPSTFGLDIAPFRVCWAYHASIESALRTIAESGEFRFTEITGYRPGRTRGRIVDGVRTEWSNHSFGTAIDINADENGLYRSCNVAEVTPATIAGCTLGMGGAWDPEGDPSRSVTRAGIVYREFVETVGWRWGGEISGNTRDLMHFSLTGE